MKKKLYIKPVVHTYVIKMESYLASESLSVEEESVSSDSSVF